MGDLRAETSLTGTSMLGTSLRRFTATLSRDWEIWGPNGGYMAAIALRAAEECAGRSRPANVTVHFLGVASFDAPVEVAVEVLRSTKQATSLEVRITQADKPILAALVWAIDDDLDGLDHDDLPMPDVPLWSELPTIGERFAAAGLDPGSRYQFWDNFDQRPADWVADWPNRSPAPALYRNWLRFVSGGPISGAWEQAARLTLLVDLGGWPSVGRRHLDESWMAPSIDVSCELHRPATGDEWLLLEGSSPIAGDGLVASHQHVWNDRGQLLASGISHMLCRRIR